MMRAVVGPLVACIPMVGAVFAVRHGLGLTERAPLAGLILEVVAGALVYCGSALVVCRSSAADFFSLLRKSFRGGGLAASERPLGPLDR
jgi:lipopolysaccharide exporter